MTKLEEALEYLSAASGDIATISAVSILCGVVKELSNTVIFINEYVKEHKILLLDYYMAHAPEEPQGWFEPKMDRHKPRPPLPKHIMDTRLMSENTPEEVAKIEAYIEAVIEYDKELPKQRLLQWPRAWAEEMIKQREK